MLDKSWVGRKLKKERVVGASYIKPKSTLLIELIYLGNLCEDRRKVEIQQFTIEIWTFDSSKEQQDSIENMKYVSKLCDKYK